MQQWNARQARHRGPGPGRRRPLARTRDDAMTQQHHTHHVDGLLVDGLAQHQDAAQYPVSRPPARDQPAGSEREMCLEPSTSPAPSPSRSPSPVARRPADPRPRSPRAPRAGSAQRTWPHPQPEPCACSSPVSPTPPNLATAVARTAFTTSSSRRAPLSPPASTHRSYPAADDVQPHPRPRPITHAAGPPSRHTDAPAQTSTRLDLATHTAHCSNHTSDAHTKPRSTPWTTPWMPRRTRSAPRPTKPATSTPCRSCTTNYTAKSASSRSLPGNTRIVEGEEAGYVSVGPQQPGDVVLSRGRLTREPGRGVSVDVEP